ncbi:DNA polymerase III subunit delta [Pseudomonadota bacterium]
MSQPIYLFHGEDSFSSQQKARLWKDEFIKKYDDMNIQLFEGADFTASQFNEAVETVPFLSEKKLIIIRDFIKEGVTEESKKVADKLDDLADYCVVVFTERQKADSRLSLFKKIKKIGTATEFLFMEKYDLTQWILKEVADKGGSISSANAALLADTVGPDLWQMTQEVEKLVLHADSNEISAEVINSLVTPNLSESIFRLTDHLAQKQQQRSIRTFNTLIESGEDMMQTLFMIVRHFRILIEVKSCMDKGMGKPAIISAIKEHPYVIQTTMGQAKNFDLPTLKRVYETLLQIDSDIKGGRIRISTENNNELRLAIEKFIVEMSA